MSDKDLNVIGSKKNPHQIKLVEFPGDRYQFQKFDGNSWSGISDVIYSTMDEAVGSITYYLKDLAAGDDVTINIPGAGCWTLKGQKQ